jgi:TRAP-type uncharacterized transport system substrate-binding protein
MAKHMRMHWRLIGVGFGVLLLCLAGYNYCRVYWAREIHLSWSGGSTCALRTEMAGHICNVVRNAGIALEPRPLATSEEVCEAVESNRLDVGLVLGGFKEGQYKNVQQLATLGVEPLHLLVKSELVTGSAPLDVLRGRRVQLGEKGTNGEQLAEQFLAFAGIHLPTTGTAGDLEPLCWAEREVVEHANDWRLAAAADRPALAADLPDAVFTVSSVPSPLVDELMKTGAYQLVPLPYATALHLDIRRNHGRQGHWLENDRVEATAIPAYAYGIRPAIPAEDCPTFGLQRLLVANKNVSPQTAYRLLRALESDEVKRYNIDLDESNTNCEFPIQPGAAAYAQGRRPLMLGQVLEPLTNVFSVLGATCAGSLAIWGFLRNLRAVSPEVHLKQIDRIERLLQGSESDESAPKLPLEFVAYLEARLAQIKQAAIDDYARGRLDGDEALVGILTMIADTRQLLMQRRKQLCLQETIIPTQPKRMQQAA